MVVNAQSIKERDRTVDILRGIGIIIMVWGHIGLCDVLEHMINFSIWYHAFHMPLFYIISGYFFDKANDDEKKFISGKAKHLLVPYVFWGAFYILYYCVRESSWEKLSSLIENFFVDPTMHGNPIAGALWFLPALFWINVIYFFMNRMFGNRWILLAASIFVSLCGMLATTGQVHLPMALDSALPGIIFMETGVLLRDIRETKAGKQIFHMKWFIFMPLIVLVNWLFFVNPEVNFRSGSYGIYPLTYFNVVVATILLWNISRVIEERLRGLFLFVPNVLASIGRNSLIYLVLNQWMQIYLSPVFTDLAVLGGNRHILQIATRWMAVVVICFVCHVVMCAMGGSERLRKFVGK